MSTIIRVKRRCDEEPQDVIVLNCKKRKINVNNDEKEQTENSVLQLAGTVNHQKDDILKHYKTFESEQLKHLPNALQSIRDKVREECYNNSKANRYKVINLCRSTNIESNDEDVTIVDVETDALISTTRPDIRIDKAKSPEYVYDLYYTTSDDLGEINDHDLLGVYPLSNELVYGSHRDNGYVDSDEELSEDSNAENNWRNEYPDEDECFDDDAASINEDDMLAAMRRVNLNGDDCDVLSTDEEVEGFIYSIDSEAAGFEEDIDDSDVNRYGERYARFKAHYKRHECDCSVVDDEDFYYDYDADSDDRVNEANTSNH